jgi:hypothetical protein
MSRTSQQEAITEAVQHYLSQAEVQTPEECPLYVRNVAAALKVSPTTLYKYGLDQFIVAAHNRQLRYTASSETAREQHAIKDRLQELRVALEREQQRNKGLVVKIVLMEANTARLGFDPDELYKPIPKPLRSVSRAGQGKGLRK